MRRLVWLLPLCFGLFIGFTAPSESTMTSWYTILMLPPSGSGGQSPALTCGWHDQGCTSGAVGNYLDWDNTDTLYVYFRGFFKRDGAPYETDKLSGERLRVQGGPEDCEIQDIDIRHLGTGSLIGKMRYVHLQLNTTSSFTIPTYGGGNGQYSSKWIGSMVANDSGMRCPWFGTHVHAGYYNLGQGSRSKNTSLYPSSDYCAGASCRKLKNDSAANWTHKFTWYGN
jgi:hypothetical protein